jgi:hypothetical protein
MINEAINGFSLERDRQDVEKIRVMLAQFYLDCFADCHSREAENVEELAEYVEKLKSAVHVDPDSEMFKGWALRYAVERARQNNAQGTDSA